MVAVTSVPVRRDTTELMLLLEIARMLSASAELADVGEPLLRAIAEHMGMLRGTLSLLDRPAREIRIEAAYGLTVEERERGRYRLGEGITGRVVESDRPAVVRRLAEEPLFLDKTRARRSIDKRDVSFLCVPIRSGGEVYGALSADRLFADDVDLDEDLRLLTIIASLVAQAVRVHADVLEEHKSLLEENARLHTELKDRFKPSNIIGSSSAMHAVYELIAQVSTSDATALLLGESGAGKELVAAAIHYNSQRAAKPFVKVNCAALPDTLLESELFGHEQGAFTGATRERKGRFELAHGGTLFLDEVGDLSLMAQTKLLRALQEREFERVGGTKTLRADVRVIAATHRNLEERVKEGAFREDLFWRLNVFPIRIPPLRERKTDILLLADHFVEKYSRQSHKRVRRISTPAIDMLMAYHWPGNVRELENTIERAVLLSGDDVIRSHHLPPTLQTPESTGTGARDLGARVGDVEREILVEALKAAGGNRAKAARALGITERLMGLRVKKHGIDARRFRPVRRA